MKKANLAIMSVDELVELFASICLAQYQASLSLETSKYNKLYEEMVAVREELKRRSGDQRRALIDLYGHQNPQVRLQAARVTLAIAPEAARAVIEAVASSRQYPQAGDAGMTLSNLDRGIFKPT